MRGRAYMYIYVNGNDSNELPRPSAKSLYHNEANDRHAKNCKILEKENLQKSY